MKPFLGRTFIFRGEAVYVVVSEPFMVPAAGVPYVWTLWENGQFLALNLSSVGNRSDREVE